MEWWRRLVALCRPRRLADDLDDELQHHLEMRAQEEQARGASLVEARLAARRRFGSVALAADRSRDADVLTVLDTFLRDLRHAARLLARTPTVTLAALASLALGIGANTALFSVLDALAWRALPVREPNRLVQVRLSGHDAISGPAWRVLRDHASGLDGAFAWGNARINIGAPADSRFVPAQLVSGRFFEVLGVEPLRGRLLDVSDDRAGGGPGGPAAVISAALWRREFAGAPNTIGRRLTVDGQPFTIVGVAPASFFGVDVGRAPDVFLPLETEPLVRGRDSYLGDWYSRWLRGFGRLPAGGSLEGAASALQGVLPVLHDSLPRTWSDEDRQSHLRGAIALVASPSGTSWLRERYGRALFALAPVVSLVLLIACVNVANLLLARAESRRHEFAVRLALGASRAQLVRQLLTESLLLALLGAGIGLGFAWAAAQLLVAQLSTQALPIGLQLSLDGRVLGFTVALAMLTAVIFGLAPARHASAAAPVDALDRRGHSARRRSHFGMANGLVTVQIGLSLVLAIAAGLFLRSFTQLVSRSPGFDRRALAVVNADVGRAVETPADRTAMYDRLLDAIRSAPEVKAAAAAINTPAAGWMWTTSDVRLEGAPPASNLSRVEVFVNAVSSGYFATMRTPLVAGRDFEVRDAIRAPRVAIVNETFARRWLSAGPAVGASIRFGEDRGGGLQIVGVVADAVYRRPQDRIPPTVYLSLAQARPRPAISFVVEPRGPAATMLASIQRAVARVHPEVTLEVRSLDRQFNEALLQERLLAGVSTTFGALGLVLAAVGLYGVMSFAVARRRRELGIRLALGAAPARLKGLVLRDVARLTIVGVGVGVVAALVLVERVGDLLVDLPPTDVVTWLVAIGTLALTAFTAGYLPARRAARVDPVTSLRDE
jgi:putative ABC transport system permease protein